MRFSCKNCGCKLECGERTKEYCLDNDHVLWVMGNKPNNNIKGEIKMEKKTVEEMARKYYEGGVNRKYGEDEQIAFIDECVSNGLDVKEVMKQSLLLGFKEDPYTVRVLEVAKSWMRKYIQTDMSDMDMFKFIANCSLKEVYTGDVENAIQLIIDLGVVRDLIPMENPKKVAEMVNKWLPRFKETPREDHKILFNLLLEDCEIENVLSAHVSEIMDEELDKEKNINIKKD